MNDLTVEEEAHEILRKESNIPLDEYNEVKIQVESTLSYKMICLRVSAKDLKKN